VQRLAGLDILIVPLQLRLSLGHASSSQQQQGQVRCWVDSFECA
jgi:hypothetical protein